MSDFALSIAGLTKCYGDFVAVDHLDLDVHRGSVHGFLGPNGAGKTTTLRMVLAIYRPTSGSVSILGQPSALDVRERIGYLPEEKGLYKKMRASALIAYFGQLKGMGKRQARKRAGELLERYELGDKAKMRCEALSKGQQQKLQVLASIVHQPEFVILDEPFSGLDPVNQDVMERLIHDMRDEGKTIIFSTHVMEHAERLCDKLTLIARGKKIFDGTLAEARNSLPRRVHLETTAQPAQLEGLPGVVGVKPEQGAEGRFELELSLDAPADTLLAECLRSGIELTSFDKREPGLREVFIELVGEQAFRAEEGAA